MRLHIANQVNPLLPGVASGHYDVIKIKLQQMLEFLNMFL